MTPTTIPKIDASLNHVEFYVADADKHAMALVNGYGFQLIGTRDNSQQEGEGGGYSLALRQEKITLVLTQGISEQHPARTYVETHGDGVADIALRVPNAFDAFEEAVERGAEAISPPRTLDEEGEYAVATIRAFGDVSHSFVRVPERARNGALPPGFVGAPKQDGVPGEMSAMDHFAICLHSGELDQAVRWYESVLGFGLLFEEHIKVGDQAMLSKVVQNSSGDVTLTLIEPDSRAEAGQIDDFLKNHGGAGVQHIAFNTDNVVRTVANLRRRGVEFLTTPGAYYDQLPQRLEVHAYSVDQLREHNILVDQDHGGQLFQIFTTSTHPRNTLFYEVIERAGAETFGSNNIQALYEAKAADTLG